jgi:hypothetical protein
MTNAYSLFKIGAFGVAFKFLFGTLKKIFSGFLPCGLTLAVLTSSHGVYPFLSVAPYIVGHPLLVFLSRV